MNRGLLTLALICAMFTIGTGQSEMKQNQESQSLTNNQLTTMNTHIMIFEIPANDIARAVSFYEAILDFSIQQMEIPGMQMGIFPYEDQAVTGLIIQGEGYTPSTNGVTIYLNGGDDLQIILDKVADHGGEVLLPKTQHGDENGYFALFVDTEGNRIGLHSPN